MSSSTNSSEQAKNASYKPQLDRIAVERRSSPQDGQSVNPIVEKITEYIPAASKVLGGSKHEQHDPSASSIDVPGPPNRPDHDHKIEDFVRDQHRSVTDDGVLNTGKSSS